MDGVVRETGFSYVVECLLRDLLYTTILDHLVLRLPAVITGDQ